MTKKIITVCCLLLLSAGSYLSFSQQSPSQRESFNMGWKFIKYDHSASENAAIREPEGLQLPTLSDAGWKAVDVPHDWAIAGPFNDTLENNTGLLPWKGIGWYRKHFSLNEADKGKRIYVEFEGAMAYAKVWLNGKYVVNGLTATPPSGST
jgi:beta-galactosidase